MDEGWYHPLRGNLEKPRFGLQPPYDRGRGGVSSNDDRICFQCGQDGHLRKYCPQLDSRHYCESARSAGGAAANGRGYWSESLRDGSSNRRAHFDHHESGPSPDDETPEGEWIKHRGRKERRPMAEQSSVQDCFHAQSGKGRRASRWSARRDEDEASSSQDAHVLGAVRNSLSDPDKELELVRPVSLAAAAQACEEKARKLGFERKRHHTGGKDESRLGSDGSVASDDTTRSNRSGGLNDRKNALDCHQKDLSSRERSVDKTSERNVYNKCVGSSGREDFYRHGEYVGDYDHVEGNNRLRNSSDFLSEEEGRERQCWGSLDWRPATHREAHSGHSQRRPSSYVSVCNARFLQQQTSNPIALVPSSGKGAFPSNSILSSNSEQINNNLVESRRKGWMFRNAQGNLQGPVTLIRLKELMHVGKLQADYMVQHEGSNDWVTIEHAQTPVSSEFGPPAPNLPEKKSPRVSESSPLVCPPIAEEFHPEQPPSVGNSDQDICLPGKEVCIGEYGDDQVDFRIDERIEKLMDGITFIPGKEKDVVHDALCEASRRVQQEYESDAKLEGSPQSYGGFANLGDHSIDEEFESHVQGLEVSGFHQQSIHIDASDDVAGVQVESDGGIAEVLGGLDPTPAVNRHAKSNQESWKWPSRGGDWKVVYVMDISQQSRGESQGSLDKGCPAYPKKVVMNQGLSLCRSKNFILIDPRKQFQVDSKVLFSGPSKLLVPKFSHKGLNSRLESFVEESQSQHCVTTPKGPNASSRSRGSTTPSAHLSTPVKDCLLSGGLSSGLKSSNSGRSSTAGTLVTGIWSKSPGQVKQQQPVAKGYIAGDLSIKHKSPAAIDKFGHGLVAVGLGKSHSEPALDHTANSANRKSRHGLPDGSIELPPPSLQQQVCDSELFEVGKRKPSKGLFLNTFPSSTEDLVLKDGHWYYLDGSGHEVGPFLPSQFEALVSSGKLLERSSVYRKIDDTWIPLRKDVSLFHHNHPQFLGFTRGKLHEYVMKSYKAVFSAVLNEGLDKWYETKEQHKSIVATAAAGVLVSPLRVATSPKVSEAVSAPVSLIDNLSGIVTVSVSEKLQVEELEEDSVQSTRLLLDNSVVQASSCVIETACLSADDGARMMEAQAWDSSTSVMQDVAVMDGSLHRHKRKAFSLDYGHPSKQHCKSSQRRCRSGKEEKDGMKKPGHSFQTTLAVNSTLSPLLDVNSTKVSEAEHLEIMEHVQARLKEKSWAFLRPSLLRLVFRSFRGDVKTLVNAMVTCTSWLAVGKKCKTKLKLADLSSVHQHSLNAVLESLPGFGGKLQRIILTGCAVNPHSLEHLLRACPSISVIEMGCSEPMKQLIDMFPKVRWLGDHAGLHSPRERLLCRREDMKIKSFRVVVEREDGEHSETHPVNESASKAKGLGHSSQISTEVETLVNDPEASHLTRESCNGAKDFKLNNSGMNGFSKTAKSGTENRVSRFLLKRKEVAASLRRKHEKGGFRSPVDKHTSTSVKVECGPKSMLEEDKSLEKEMATVLNVMMDADTDRCFQSANMVTTHGKAFTSAAGKMMDLLMIEKKLKGGAYAGGKDGFKAFKEDVNLLIRSAFRQQKGMPIYSTAEKIFKLALHHFASLDSQIAGTVLAESQYHGKLSGPRTFAKAGKGRLKNLSMLQQHFHGKKRMAWDADGVKRSKQEVMKRRRQGESNSGDVDSDPTAHEAKRVAKSKKEQWWDSDGESSEEEEETVMEEDEEETETEASDSEVPSESEGEDGIFEDDNHDTEDEQSGYHDWGARMTKAAMVPPVTRKYMVIEEYRIVADKERIEEKMKVDLPWDYEDKLKAAKDRRSDSTYSHLDIPERKGFKPRKKLGEEVLEQEVYGIDPYTHNLLWDTMPADIMGFSETEKQQFIEETLLLALNKEARQYTGNGKAPTEFNLEVVVERILVAAEIGKDWGLHEFSQLLLNNIRNRPKDKFVAYRKGLGVVCNTYDGLEKDEFVVEFFGEVYPPWRWYEKQDGIRCLQKKDKDTNQEFYNIMYERPKGDAAGYDLLVVDAMHKANFASRLCHSCRPNCEAKITAVNDTYIIGVYTLKPIKHGEELTFDYNSVTESKEEYNNAVCLCGTQGCRGSYLNLTGSGTFEEVILTHHGLLDRHHLLLDSCITASVTDQEQKEMSHAGLGSCLLSGLPNWVLKYAAGLVHFMNFEKIHLPSELLKDFDLKRKQGVLENCTELDAEITVDGVYNQRLQNLAITLDKVRHILTKLYGNPLLAPPPLRKLHQKDMVLWIWTRDDSVVNELVQSLGPHLPEDILFELKQSISKHAPQESGTNLSNCLLWLRDELRRLPATCKARHDAAADLIHIYAYTKCFFTTVDYSPLESTPMNIHPLELGSSRHSLSGVRSWHKTYSREYVRGQLINWYTQNEGDPGASIPKAARGCLILPDISSCYAKSMHHDFRHGYGQKHREKMISHMMKKPQQKWPTSKFWSRFWCFKNERGLFGSPMLDSVIAERPLDDQMLEWLKSREDVFVGPWDDQ